MPKQVLTRRRSWTARIAVLAVVLSLFAVALPASAHSVAISTSTSCPASIPNAGFTDIAAFGTDVQLAINCLFAFGITSGTTATTYSPNGTVLRWQMALFLVRQAADHGITIPAAASQGYTDIAGLPQATIDAINQVTQLGISKGTTSTTFSPNDVVTRWQMALFLRRLAGLAGVTVTDDPAHNQFTDIGAFSAEIQAAVNFLADGHIALGTGGSLFSPNDPVFRWAMALFLTRVLAADGVPAPAGIQVTVTPTDAVTLASGGARAFVATFKNADGTPYTGNVTLLVADVNASDNAISTDGADNVDFQTADVPFAGPLASGFPGTDGIVNVVIRHDGLAGEKVRVFAWQDSDADLLVDTGEQSGQGGLTTFSAVAAGEADDLFAGTLDVVSVNNAGDSFTAADTAAVPVVDCGEGVGAACTFNHDALDIFLIEGAVSNQASFEAALNVGDEVTVDYRDAVAGVSTFDISNDVAPLLTVTDPPAAGKTVDVPPGGTTTVSGTGTAGFIVEIWTDADNGTDIDGGVDFEVAETTVTGAGTWSVPVPLIQNAPNDFTANQRASAASPLGTPVNVPTITEGAAAQPNIESVVNTFNGGIADVLDGGDTLALDFDVLMSTDFSGDSIQVTDGTDTATLTHGVNATFSSPGADDVIVITILGPLGVTINGVAALNNPVGFQSATGVVLTSAVFNVDVDRNFDII